MLRKAMEADGEGFLPGLLASVATSKEMPLACTRIVVTPSQSILISVHSACGRCCATPAAGGSPSRARKRVDAASYGRKLKGPQPESKGEMLACLT